MQTIDDVYRTNDAICGKFKEAVMSAGPDRFNTHADGEAWTVAQIAEHVAVVKEGSVKICSKLLAKAEAAGTQSDGSLSLTAKFLELSADPANAKLEAPEMVRPTGAIPVEESLARIDAAHDAMLALREKFVSFHSTEIAFPHPYFGPMTAQDWFVLSGGHEARHLKQLRRILEKL